MAYYFSSCTCADCCSCLWVTRNMPQVVVPKNWLFYKFISRRTNVVYFNWNILLTKFEYEGIFFPVGLWISDLCLSLSRPQPQPPQPQPIGFFVNISLNKWNITPYTDNIYMYRLSLSTVPNYKRYWEMFPTEVKKNFPKPSQFRKNFRKSS